MSVYDMVQQLNALLTARARPWTRAEHYLKKAPPGLAGSKQKE